MNKPNQQAKQRQTHNGEQMTASGVWLVGGGIEQKGKRTHGHAQKCGDCWGSGSIRGLKGNGKNTIKIK